MADVEMSMDQHLALDKKSKKPAGGQNKGRGGALPGKGRGGSNQNNSKKQTMQYVPRQQGQNQINKNQQRKQTEQRQQQRHMRRGGPVHSQNPEQRQNNGNQQYQVKQRQNNANSNDNQSNRRQQIQQLKQRSRGTMQNPRQRIARQQNNNSQSGQYQNNQQNKQNQQRNLPKSPVIANQSPNQSRSPKTLTVVKGQLAQRKIKVRNIDPRNVSTQDLYKLFAKSGQLISATFDTNEFGQYIGTATIIYTNANGASRAIKDYHLAQIDKRTMKVDYAMQPVGSGGNAGQNGSPLQVKSPQVQKQQHQQVATGKGGRGGVAQTNQNQRGSSIRRTDARIQKSGRGRTLNVAGSERKNYRRGSRQ